MENEHMQAPKPMQNAAERSGWHSGDMRVMLYIADLLQSLGVGRHYRGYAMALEAIRLAVYQEDTLTQMRHCVLEPIAGSHGCSWKCVDRNLRTVINCAWRTNAPKLQALCTYPLQKEPSVAGFLSLMSSHVQRQLMRRAIREASAWKQAAVSADKEMRKDGAAEFR